MVIQKNNFKFGIFYAIILFLYNIFNILFIIVTPEYLTNSNIFMIFITNVGIIGMYLVCSYLAGE